jgi:PWWP domain
MAISVEIGLLPPDTVVIAGPNKTSKKLMKKPIISTHRQKQRLKNQAALSDEGMSLDEAAFSQRTMSIPRIATQEERSNSLDPATKDVLDVNLLPLPKKKRGKSKEDVDATKRDEVADTLVEKKRKKSPFLLKQDSEKEGLRKETQAADAASSSDAEDSESEGEEEETGPPPEPLDPEVTLDADSFSEKVANGMPTTVHFSPKDPDCRRIGWKVRIVLEGHNRWVDGRVVRYDPHSHKHKIVLENTTSDGGRLISTGGMKSQPQLECWIWLRNEEHNLHLAVDIVWAKVKGYAWWPALIREPVSVRNSDGDSPSRADRHVQLEFFGTNEVSTLRNSAECIRPFTADSVDPVVAKHKKKRNEKAYALALEECRKIRDSRNEAAVFYATKALDMVNARAVHPSLGGLVGRRIKLFRSDINYPYGEGLYPHLVPIFELASSPVRSLV